jgi:predicted CXXCH cytochrome family protein
VPRKLVWLVVALAGALGLSAVGLGALAATERHDRFCVACHLHEQKFDRFVGTPATDLTGPHHAKDVRCIDCHGGADPVMRVRVWTLAAVDTGRFLVGRYKEPERMALPLRAKDCAVCHTPIVKNAAGLTAEQEEALEGRIGNTYHAIRPHDTVKITCVRCHTAHTSDSDARRQFIARSRVEPICRECHATLGE